MRIRIVHETLYRYDTPAKSAIQLLRMTPRNHDSQYVVRWRVDVSEDCRLDQREDAFGNLTHSFTLDGPISELRIGVDGEVETQDTAGVIRGTVERFPASLYLRETDLTKPDDAIVEFAEKIGKRKGASLEKLHRLNASIFEGFTFLPNETDTKTTAAESFAMKSGVCQDYSHVFVASARHLGIPARYVGGYFLRGDGMNQQQAGHAWSEAYLDDLGWVAFDPANGIAATDAHIRVAIGLDYMGAAPVRGVRFGGTGEKLSVNVNLDQSSRQSQS